MKGTLPRALAVAALLVVSPMSSASAEVLDGTNGPDTLVGTQEADIVRGHGGADTIYGRAGADRVRAGRDNSRDDVHAGPGADLVLTRLGDRVHAGRGDDVVRIGTAKGWGMTHVFCGPGHDRLYETWGGDHSGAGEPDDGNDWLVAWHGCEEVY